MSEHAWRRATIDTRIDSTLSLLYATVKGSRELACNAHGALVFPSLLQTGIVLGAHYGEGAMRISCNSAGYYSAVSSSFGLRAGMQPKSLVFLFMTQTAIDRFRGSDDWPVSDSGMGSLVKVGTDGIIDSHAATAPVEVLTLTDTGLVGELSFANTKVSHLNIPT